jgi:hypothetical protein
LRRDIRPWSLVTFGGDRIDAALRPVRSHTESARAKNGGEDHRSLNSGQDHRSPSS